MSDNPLDRLPTHNRVSIRAVLVRDGEDPSAGLADAGFVDAIAIPVMLGEELDLAGGILGNGITPNLTGVLETGQREAYELTSYSSPQSARSVPDGAKPSGPVTTSLPAAFGMRPRAPVRRIDDGRSRRDAAVEPDDDRTRMSLSSPGRFMSREAADMAKGTKHYPDASESGGSRRTDC